MISHYRRKQVLSTHDVSHLTPIKLKSKQVKPHDLDYNDMSIQMDNLNFIQEHSKFTIIKSIN